MSERKVKGIHDGPHKYFQAKFKQSGTVIYRCGLPNCPHFIYEPLIVGKLSICFRCGNEFIVTLRSTRSKKMHCEDCTRGRYNKPRKKTDITESLLSDVEQIMKSEYHESD